MANNKIVLFISVLLFGWVISRPQKDICIGLWNVSINPYILAVYLIHDNPHIRPLLWNNLIVPRNYIQQLYLIPYCLLLSIVIFGICLGVEWFRTTISNLLFISISGSHIRKKQ